MNRHDKLSFTAEYCRCIRINHMIKHDALFIKKNDGHYFQVCYNLYNLDFLAIICMVCEFCDANGIDRFNY